MLGRSEHEPKRTDPNTTPATTRQERNVTRRLLRLTGKRVRDSVERAVPHRLAGPVSPQAFREELAVDSGGR